MLDKDSGFYIPQDASRRTAILDTNLLVVMITARVDITLFEVFKRVKSFVKNDIELLLSLLSLFQDTVTTAYALAEASNLGNALNGRKRQLWFEELAKFATVTNEAHIPTNIVAKSPLFNAYGVTDAALALLAEKHVLITAEYRLAGQLSEMGLTVINFNHLRPLWMS